MSFASKPSLAFFNFSFIRLGLQKQHKLMIFSFVVLGEFIYFYRCDELSPMHVSPSLQMCSLLTV